MQQKKATETKQGHKTYISTKQMWKKTAANMTKHELPKQLQERNAANSARKASAPGHLGELPVLKDERDAQIKE